MSKLFCLLYIALFLNINTGFARVYDNPLLTEPLNPNKAVDDAMIEQFYKNPEAVILIDRECADIDEMKGVFTEEERSNHYTTLCLKWLMNKKISSEQIELLTQLYPPFEEVIRNLYRLEDYTEAYSDIKIYRQELTVKMYNLILRKNWPECEIENTDTKTDSELYYTDPCNDTGKILAYCKDKNDTVSCMKDKLLSEYYELSLTEYHKQTLKDYNKKMEHLKLSPVAEDVYHAEAQRNMEKLLDISIKIINEFVNSAEQQEKEITQLYNFYELMLTSVHKKMVGIATLE